MSTRIVIALVAAFCPVAIHAQEKLTAAEILATGAPQITGCAEGKIIATAIGLMRRSGEQLQRIDL